MSRHDVDRNYAGALALAREVAARHLAAHVRRGREEPGEALEDLAQSIVGTDRVVQLIMAEPFREEVYLPALTEAADEVGRLFFPDVYKRFITSLDRVPEQAAVEPPSDQADAEAALPPATDELPDDLRAYLDRLLHAAGTGPLTSHLWEEADAEALADRLARLRRHYPDGDLGLEAPKETDRELSADEIVACARRVGAGLSVAFPFGFFARQTQDRIAIATRYLVEHEARRPAEELVREGVLPFVALGLGPALRRCAGSVNRLLALTYPDRIRPWMASHVPSGYWDDPANRRDAVRWLVEERLRIREDSIAEAVHGGRLGKREFADAGLTWLLKNVYGWSVAGALADAYPGLEPWERMRRAPPSLWESADCAMRAIRWALRRAGTAPEDLRTQAAARLIRAALRPWHLVGAFAIGFRGDAARAVEAAFPGTFRPWETSRLPREAWTDPNLRAGAIRWLLDRLGIEPAEIPRAIAEGRLTPGVLKDAGLDGILRVTGSVWRAIADVFPGRFARWELGAVPRSWWRSRQHVREAVLWTMARLGVPEDQVPAALADGRLGAEAFVGLGLGSLVTGIFRDDAAALCEVAGVASSERRVPLSRYYRQSVGRPDDRLVTWRLRAGRGRIPADTGELDRHVSISRSIRDDRRRARDRT